MTTEPKGLTDAWLVICAEGFDSAFEHRAIANEHCNIMAAEFPQMGPWRVRRFIDAAGAASVPREPDERMCRAGALTMTMDISDEELEYARQTWLAMYDAARDGK